MTQEKALKKLKSGVNVFLTGEGGAGKTHTINQFIEYLDDKRKNYAVTASTGIASTHINGKTIHSWSGLGIRKKLSPSEIKKVAGSSYTKERLLGTEVLIIDEISMVDGFLLNDVDKVLREVKQKNEAFGGIQVVFVGDFFQLPPVVRGNEELLFAFDSEAWKSANLEICYLTEQHRQNDTEFLDILNSLRSGSITDGHKERLNQCQVADTPETKIFTHNIDVDRLNKQKLDEIQEPLKTFKMRSWGSEKTLDTLKKYCLSPENLELKVGAVVMFTRNNFKEGYVNGTIGKVKDFRENGAPIIELLDGTIVKPDRAEWECTRKRQVVASIEQYPLRLAWAITVHKSQGMSLDSAEIDLSDTFEYGQGYVALSRVRSLQGLHLSGINDMAFQMHPRVVEQDAIFRELGV